MEIGEIVQIISTLGFPGAMCVCLCKYIKTLTVQYQDEIRQLTDDYREDIRDLRQTVENNTLAINMLLEEWKHDKQSD